MLLALALRVLLFSLTALLLLPAMAAGFVSLLLAIHAGRFPDDVAVLLAFAGAGLLLWLAYHACAVVERAVDRVLSRLS